MSSTPSMRAAHLQQNVESLRNLGREREARVLELVSPATLEAIRESTRSVWLPVDLDVELSEAVTTALGPRALRDWSRDALLRSMETPFLRSLTSTAVRLFGLSPRGLCSWMPRGWDAVYRECGALRFDALGERKVQLVLEGIPGVMARAPTYLEGVAGAFEAVLVICKVRGTVTLEPRAQGSTSAVFTIEWGQTVMG